MKKEEYLQKLEQLLYNIPAEDRYEAIQFYSDYLEDAGADVDEVLHALGSPEELAKSIQKDLYGDNEMGDFTRSYKDVPGTYRVPFSTSGRFSGNAAAYSEGYSNDAQANVGQKRKGKMTTGQWILFIILLIFAAPIIVPVCGSIIGIMIAVLVTIIAIVLGIGVAGIALVIAAIVVVAVAVVKFFVSPLSAVVMLGGGLFTAGIGLIGIGFTLWIVCKLLPKLFVALVNVFSGIVHKK